MLLAGGCGDADGPPRTESNLILFLERKSIKKNFYFESTPIAIPEFLPGNDIAFLIEE